MSDLIPKQLHPFLRPVDEIRPYAGNPRVIPDIAVTTVAQSINTYGFWQPIVVDNDADCVIVAGHTRYAAALALGLKEIPVISMEGLPSNAARMYRLTDNKTGELSTWDLDGLKLELYDLGQEDMIPIGFEDEMEAFTNFTETYGHEEEKEEEKASEPNICPTCGQVVK